MTMLNKQVILRLLLILGIIILANVIAVRVFTRIDLTSTKAYTLSDASKQLVKSLDDKFIVKAYFSSEIPAPYNNHRRYLQDQLDEYRAYGRGNFEYEFIDPSSRPELEQEAQRSGIPPVQVQVIKDDKLQIEKAYMGVAFLYGEKREVLPVVQSFEKLEYEISSNIKKMTSRQMPKVGMLTGHDEPAMEQLEEFRQMLGKQYEISQVDLSGGKPVSPFLNALLIISPKKKLAGWEKYLIDQYIMLGGRVGFFIDNVDVNLESPVGRLIEHGLGDMLEAYGIRVNADLVRDTRCANVTISQQSGFMVFQSQVPFPYLPIASEYNEKHILVRNLPAVLFYFVSSLDMLPDKNPEASIDVLLSSSNRSGRQTGTFIVNPTMQFTRDMFMESHLPLAATVHGRIKSMYAERPVVIDTSVPTSIDTSQRIRETANAKIAVVGDGNFIQRGTMGSRDNLVFAAALVDWLVDDIGLSSIRSRDIAAKPLDEVSEGTKTMVKSLNLAAPPLIVIAIGVIRWRMRAALRKRIQMSS